ncbi:MAG TPA: hypothetical protein VK674_05070 [Candidatus Limnocylindria bacterium]|nr:hypothetical protein [Candidatus Limnocylindria bacterium]
MKYVLGVFGVILVAILAIILIMRVGRGDPKPTERPLVVSEEAREGVSAVITTQGRLVGEDQRRAIRISISQTERRLEILTGYEEAVDRAQTYPSTPAAFEAFLIALDQAGFDNKRKSTVNDMRGACPLGKRYVYELKEYSQDLLSSWDTSCGGKLGTFNGGRNTIRKLFEQQIPDYTKQIRGVDLRGQKVATDEGS